MGTPLALLVVASAFAHDAPCHRMPTFHRPFLGAKQKFVVKDDTCTVYVVRKKDARLTHGYVVYDLPVGVAIAEAPPPGSVLEQLRVEAGSVVHAVRLHVDPGADPVGIYPFDRFLLAYDPDVHLVVHWSGWDRWGESVSRGMLQFPHVAP